MNLPLIFAIITLITTIGAAISFLKYRSYKIPKNSIPEEAKSEPTIQKEDEASLPIDPSIFNNLVTASLNYGDLPETKEAQATPKIIVRPSNPFVTLGEGNEEHEPEEPESLVHTKKFQAAGIILAFIIGIIMYFTVFHH